MLSSAEGTSGVSSSEQRRWQRVKVGLPGEIRAVPSLGEESGTPEAMTMWNLSRGGAYVVSDHRSVGQEGSLVRIAMTIPLESRRHIPFSLISGTCRVVRVEPVTTPSGTHEGMALAFCADRMVMLGTTQRPR